MYQKLTGSLLGFPTLFWLFTAFACALFLLFPEIDIKFSSLFYDNGFYMETWPFIEAVYLWAPRLLNLCLILLILGTLYSLIFKKTLFNIKKAVLLYLLFSILLGPGVLVNLILKDHVDRARPRHVMEFGGDKQFTPALVISDQCEQNCSFVSGHAAGGFVFIALALLFQGRRRHQIFTASVLYGGSVGLIRIIQGGHFLSDIVFAFIFTYLVVRLIFYLFFERGKEHHEYTT